MSLEVIFMEEFRINQAQSLLRDAVKSKTGKEKLKSPREGTINVKVFEKVLNLLFEAEEFIYTSRPTHELDMENATLFAGKIIEARTEIDNILSDFGVIDKNDSAEDIEEYSKDILILTTKNSFKKTITKFGVDPQRIVVAGVPLDPEDMKLLNPKIPDAALIPIKKKIAHVKNDIQRKMEQFKLKNIIVLVENDKAGEILGNRAETLYNAQTITKENLKDMTVAEFIAIVS
jgi:hypothetical protein